MVCKNVVAVASRKRKMNYQILTCVDCLTLEVEYDDYSPES